MIVFGLTGNIGTGKSTVARLFAEHGVPVIDADQVAREVVAPGSPGLAEVAARFPGVLTPSGELDRKALADRVFNDAQERAALNAILHPRIGAEVRARLDRLAARGAPVAIYEAALIVENGLHHGLDGLIVVNAPVEEQIRRLRARDGMTEEEARARIRAQLPAHDKVKEADFVIENTGAPELLRAQVARVVDTLRGAWSRGS
ncbi:MAG TPA: dephospho-CoA kinase [Myxococcales bacterium]|nr:dephospho-CoA kinase [Myxococcales bacterium]